MNIQLEIPTSWSDVTLDEFIKISELDIDTYDNVINYYIDILSVFGNDVEDVINHFKLADINLLANELSWMNTMPNKSNVKEVKIKGVNFVLTQNMNELTVGEYISIETLIEGEKLNQITAIDVILSVILRPEGEVFDATKIEARRKLFREKLNIEDVLGMSVFFSTGVA